MRWTELRCECSEQKYETGSLLTKTIGSGITVTDAAAGKFTVALDPADTLKFSGGYYHEAKAFDVSRPYTIVTGQITFETTLIR